MFIQYLLILACVEASRAFSFTTTLSSSSLSTVRCTTKLQRESPKAPISTSTLTKTLLPDVILILSESTPIQTVTPLATTTTSTVISITTVTSTNSAVTDTFSTTSTETDTFTVSSTQTTTSTSTVSSTVTSTTTTIVPSPANFEGSEQSSGDSNYGAMKRSPGHPHGYAISKASRSNKDNVFDSKYPSSVKCVDYVQVQYTEVVVFIKATSTVTAPVPTLTATTTNVVTSTSTVVPSAVSVTVSFSTTTTVTTTTNVPSSTTTITTATLTATTTVTSYAACATNNLLGPRIQNGNYLTYTDPSFDNELNQPPADDPYSCCVACITSDSNCGYGVFSIAQGYCLLILGTPTCSNPGFNAGTFYETVGSNEFNTVYSNGPCGVVHDGGVVSS